VVRNDDGSLVMARPADEMFKKVVADHLTVQLAPTLIDNQ
jgi:hypothetical protein